MITGKSPTSTSSSRTRWKICSTVSPSEIVSERRAISAAQQIHDLSHGSMRLDFVLASFHVALMAIGLNAIFKDPGITDNVTPFKPVGNLNNPGTALHNVVGCNIARSRLIERQLAKVTAAAAARTTRTTSDSMKLAKTTIWLRARRERRFGEVAVYPVQDARLRKPIAGQSACDPARWRLNRLSLQTADLSSRKHLGT